MSLPRAVLEAEKRADELLKQLNEARNPQSEEVSAVNNSQESNPDTIENGEAGDPDLISETNEAPQNEEDHSWENRYRSLMGKYNAEVPRLIAGNKELTNRLQSVESEFESVKLSKANPRELLVKQSEIDEYGEPLVDLIRRAARDEVSVKDQEIESLKHRLERFEATTNKTVETTFYEMLGNAAPNWQELNKDATFLKWLAEYDDLTGLQRQDLLDDAVRKNDAARASRFFNKWKDMSENKAAAVSRSLASQVVPSSSTSLKTASGKKLWSRPEIADFYGKARRGEINDSDMVAIEADIHAAHLEKRIR